MTAEKPRSPVSRRTKSLKPPSLRGDGSRAPALAERPPALAADFLVSAAAPNQFPEPRFPEMALLGRSNTGKSSLLNRWLGRKGLARVGAAPGRTRQINFFRVVWRPGDLPFHLADLPGYGFAAAPKDMVAGWRRLVAAYLESGRPIRLALLLMDIRREPGPDEYGLLEWLRGIEVPAELILTKADKLGGGERSRRLGQIERQFAGHAPLERPPRLFSAVTGLGRAELIADLIDSGLLTSGLAENV